MKHKSQKQICILIVTALTTSNTWASVISISGQNHSSQFLLSSPIIVAGVNTHEEYEPQSRELASRARKLFLTTINSKSLVHTEIASDKSQQQIKPLESSGSEIVSYNQNQFEENKNKTTDLIELENSESHSILHLKMLRANPNHGTNTSLGLWNITDILTVIISPSHLSSNQNSIFTVSNNFSNLLDLTMVDVILWLRSSPEYYDFQLQPLKPTTTNPKQLTAETAVPSPVKLTLFGVGLIGIGLTRKNQHSSRYA